MFCLVSGPGVYWGGAECGAGLPGPSRERVPAPCVVTSAGPDSLRCRDGAGYIKGLSRCARGPLPEPVRRRWFSKARGSATDAPGNVSFLTDSDGDGNTMRFYHATQTMSVAIS